MRFINKRRFAAAVGAAGFAFVSFTTVAKPASAELAETRLLLLAPDTAVVESVSLPNNVMLLRTAGDSLVIGPSNVQLTVVDDELGSRLGVAMPDPSTSATPGWTTESMSQVLDSVQGGASLEDIAERAGDFVTTTNASEPAYNAACVSGFDDVAYQKTCTNRQVGNNDGTYKYIGSKTFTYGQIRTEARPYWELRQITNQDNYERGTQHIVDWTPKFTQYGDCSSATFGLSGYGLSMSLSKPLCPRQLDPYHFETIEQLKTTWYGRISGAATAFQIETVRVPSASESWLVFSGATESRPKCIWNPVVCGIYYQVGG